MFFKFLLLLLVDIQNIYAEHDHEHLDLKVSGAVDIVGKYQLNKESKASDKLEIREAEITLQSPIDRLFEGQLSFAAHQEQGQAIAEVHEAFISSSKLLDHTKFKIGQYFIGVGLLNKSHRHEWPLISAPYVQEKFFGEEGILDTGVEFSYDIPLPFYLNLTAGITNGFTYGHSHAEGKKPHVPTHYIRLETDTLFYDTVLELGMNYLARSSSEQEKMSLYGLDFSAKWNQSSDLNFLVQSEFWLRNIKPKHTQAEETFGVYVLPQASYTPFSVGVLFDYYTVLSLKDALGQKIENHIQHCVPTLTYKVGESSTFRLAYNFASEKTPAALEKDQRLELQTTFIIGAHDHTH